MAKRAAPRKPSAGAVKAAAHRAERRAGKVAQAAGEVGTHRQGERFAHVPQLPAGDAEVPFHPLANAFPLIEGAEFAELVADVKANGLRRRVWFYEGQILDGRNRYRAARAAGVPVRWRLYEGRDPLGFVISENLRRRHLSESQRAMIAARLAGLAPGRPVAGAPSQALTQPAAAELLHVGERTVRHAAEVVEHGAPELQRAVEAGQVAVSTAAEVAASLPASDQAQLVVQGEAAILAAAKEIRQQKNAARRAEKTAHIIEINKGNKPLAFGGRKFVIVSADPPWRYERPLIGDSDRSIENKYPTMPIEEICAMPVHQHVADQAAIVLHIPQPLQHCLTPQGLCYPHQVGRAWGDPHWSDPDKCEPRRWFVPHAMAIWEKRSPADIAEDGGPIGMGHYFRTDHECVVLMTRGGLPTPTFKPRSVFHIRSRGELEHSEKPAEIYEAIRRMYPEYCDAGLALALFERKERPGFVVWGNQAPSQEAAA